MTFHNYALMRWKRKETEETAWTDKAVRKIGLGENLEVMLKLPNMYTTTHTLSVSLSGT